LRPDRRSPGTFPQARILLNPCFAEGIKGLKMLIQSETFHEVNHHARSLTCWPQEYDQLTAGRFEGYLQDVHFDSVRLFRERMNQGVAQHTHTPAGQIALLVPIHLDGSKTSDQARNVLADGITLLPCDEDFFFVGPPDTDYSVISLQQDQLHDLLSDEDYDTLLSARRSHGIQVKPEWLSQVRSTLMSLLQELNSNDEQLSEQQTAQKEKALRDRLVLMALDIYSGSLDSHPLHRSARPLGNQHHYLVRRCHEYALSDEGATASVLDICKQLGIARRTLNYSFAKVTGTSPAQYLRAVKLNAARRQLLTSNLPVTAVAANYGFFHTGYFSQEYRRLFGETPTATRAGRVKG
tara:strand:- start:668 stop:1723 length:1056 start_codon:yes stop_codon:yes gene_type:complete